MTQNGKNYRGVYQVERGVVTVTTLGGRKSKQVGRFSEKSIARALLRELANEGNAD